MVWGSEGLNGVTVGLAGPGLIWFGGFNEGDEGDGSLDLDIGYSQGK